MLRNACAFHSQLCSLLAAREFVGLELHIVSPDLAGFGFIEPSRHRRPWVNGAGAKVYEIPIVDFPLYIRVLSSQPDEPCIHDQETDVPSLF